MLRSQLQGQVIENMILPDKDHYFCVIPHFPVILTGKSFYIIMFVIQGDLQGQFEGHIKVKFLTILLITNTNIYFELDKVSLNAFPSSFNALLSLLNAPRFSLTSPNRPSTPSHRHLEPLQNPLTLTHCIFTPLHHILTHFRAYHLTPFHRLLTLCCCAFAPLRHFLSLPIAF